MKDLIHVRGLTTAAGTWAVAISGIVIGAGHYALGAAVSVLVLSRFGAEHLDHFVRAKFSRMGGFGPGGMKSGPWRVTQAARRARGSVLIRTVKVAQSTSRTSRQVALICSVLKVHRPSRSPRFLLGPPPTGRSTHRRPVSRTTSSCMPRSCLETCSHTWPTRTATIFEGRKRTALCKECRPPPPDRHDFSGRHAPDCERVHIPGLLTMPSTNEVTRGCGSRS